MKVSVVLPTYNSQNTLCKAIDSILNQRFPCRELEIIVVNDGSTDQTSGLLKFYEKRIKIINQENRGAVKAANRGFRSASGTYVIKLDADDYFEPSIIREMSRILDKRSRIDFVYCDYYEIDSKGGIEVVSTEDIFHTLAGGVMFRRNKLEEVGFYGENVKLPEYDLLLRVGDTWSGFRISTPLFWYIRGGTNLTKNVPWIKSALHELARLYPHKMKEIERIRTY